MSQGKRKKPPKRKRDTDNCYLGDSWFLVSHYLWFVLLCICDFKSSVLMYTQEAYCVTLTRTITQSNQQTRAQNLPSKCVRMCEWFCVEGYVCVWVWDMCVCVSEWECMHVYDCVWESMCVSVCEYVCVSVVFVSVWVCVRWMCDCVWESVRVSECVCIECVCCEFTNPHLKFLANSW